MDRLAEKVAIVTGASGGIGASTARSFVEEGARVMLVDLHEDPIRELAQELGEQVAWYAADVSDDAQVRAYVQACVDRFGGVDVLFANAGIEGQVAPLLETTESNVDRVLAVNLKGPWLAIKHAAPSMIARGGGSIVITSSAAGVVGSRGLGPYVMSKHGVQGLMRTAAVELAPHKIRVNTLNPGPIENRMMRSIEEMVAPGAAEQVKHGFEAMVPLGRYGTNDEIAGLAVFLASDEASYCTGGVYMADGGFTAV